MKKLLILIGAIAAYGQTVSISDTLTNAVGGGSYAGRIVVTLNSPGSASPLYYSSTSLTGWQYVLCVGVTGTDCSSTTAAGVVTLTLYANSTITPAGTSYSARFTPSKGSPWTETWVVTPSTTTLRQVRSSTVPTPTTTFQASQLLLGAGYIPYGASTGYGTSLAPGTNGYVLTLAGGYPSWAASAACATCVVTSGSYSDPAWITSLSGSKVSGNISGSSGSTTGNAATATALAANGTNCSAGSFPLGVDASGNSESCTALPTTITGTANQITASASTGAVTLSLPATITGLTSVTSTGFTGALTGNASTATALASTVSSGRLWIGNGTGAPTSDAGLVWDTVNGRLGAGTATPSQRLHVNGNAIITVGSSLYLGGATDASNDGLRIFSNGSTSYVDLKGSVGLVFRADNSTGATERMRLVSSTGNLLIGGTTDDGTNKLQVAGNGVIGSGTGQRTLKVFSGDAGVSESAAVLSLFSSGYREAVVAVTNNGMVLTGTTGGLANYNNATINAASALTIANTSKNLLIGTTTDLGYGLHAANKGTNGNLLVFDATAATGVSTQLITAGQGQGSTPVFRIRAYNATPGSGTLGLSILDTGRIVTASANEATGAGTPLLGTNSPAVTNTAPYTWIKFTTSDGSTVYVPAWK